MSVLISLRSNLLYQIKLEKNYALKSSRTFVVIFFNEINSINQSNFFNLFAIFSANGLRKLNDFLCSAQNLSNFAKNHALKSSRTFVVNLFNEIKSINQSNLFNLFALFAATGSRKLKEHWPKDFVTNCFNYSSNWGYLVFFDYPSR